MGTSQAAQRRADITSRCSVQIEGLTNYPTDTHMHRQKTSKHTYCIEDVCCLISVGMKNVCVDMSYKMYFIYIFLSCFTLYVLCVCVYSQDYTRLTTYWTDNIIVSQSFESR